VVVDIGVDVGEIQRVAAGRRTPDRLVARAHRKPADAEQNRDTDDDSQQYLHRRPLLAHPSLSIRDVARVSGMMKYTSSEQKITPVAYQ